MKYVMVIALCSVLVSGMPYEVAEDEEGQQYYMVPLSRARRSPQSETKVGANEKGVSVSHSGNILDTNGHRLDGSAYAYKNHHSSGIKPDQFGGQLKYNNDPSRTSAYLGADHGRGYGTDVRAGVQHDIYRTKDLSLGVGAEAGRHYGGPSGNGRPQFGGFIRGSMSF